MGWDQGEGDTSDIPVLHPHLTSRIKGEELIYQLIASHLVLQRALWIILEYSSMKYVRKIGPGGIRRGMRGEIIPDPLRLIR